GQPMAYRPFGNFQRLSKLFLSHIERLHALSCDFMPCRFHILIIHFV
ncbi:hypothetical protein EDWATA_02186, partial [Edwardsiella tarda ATCC 23685]